MNEENRTGGTELKVGRLTELFAKIEGARLCYGEPVEMGETMIVPVASVRGGGGYGFGSGTGSEGEGGGEGGGAGGGLRARPVGYIETTTDGVRFKRIGDPVRVLKAVPLMAFACMALVHGIHAHHAGSTSCGSKCCGGQKRRLRKCGCRKCNCKKCSHCKCCSKR